MESHYILPSSPSILCEDRFSILDSDELHVPLWPLLTTLLQTSEISSASSVIDLLETIAISRSGTANTDYGTLKQHLIDHGDKSNSYQTTWPQIRALALELPILFPDHRIPILTRENPSLTLSRRQVACLVVHQFLCTLTAPTWQEGFQDFHIWYGSEQPHAGAVDAYLTSLFEYFFRLASDDPTFSPVANEWPIKYTLRTRFPVQQFKSTPSTLLSPLTVLNLPEASTTPELLGLPDGAAVISANQYIGFGRTGTQEETHVGASPEVCPAVLVTPPLRDDQVLIAVGAEPMVTIEGYGRDARCTETLRHDGTFDNNHPLIWQHRTMLFMDALELDLAVTDDGIPDLLPGNVDREFKKAFIAFSSRDAGRPTPRSYEMVYTGGWGCGTFGGSLGIKSLIQWCAASMAGCPLTFICDGEERQVFGKGLERLAREYGGVKSAQEVLEVLREMRPSDVKKKHEIPSVFLS